MSARSEWVSQDANVVQTFLESYNITNDEKDFIKSSDIKDWVKENDVGISDTKFAMELKNIVPKINWTMCITRKRKSTEKV